MSAELTQQLIDAVSAMNDRLNSITANAKTTDELDPQSPVNALSRIRVSLNGISQRIDIQDFISTIRNAVYDHLIFVGAITLDGNDLTVPSSASWQINADIYVTIADAVITIPFAATDKVRKDLILGDDTGAVIRIAGTEYEDVAIRPNQPLNTVIITELDITDGEINHTPPVYPGDIFFLGAFISQESLIGGVPRAFFGNYAFIINDTQTILAVYDGAVFRYLTLGGDSVIRNGLLELHAKGYVGGVINTGEGIQYGDWVHGLNDDGEFWLLARYLDTTGDHDPQNRANYEVILGNGYQPI